MKKQLGVMLGIAALLPMAGLADITVTAAGQTSGYAYIYNNTTGAIAGQANFNASGVAVIPTGSIAAAQYGVGVTYDSTEKWVSNVAIANAHPTFMTAGYSASVTAITGAISTRSFTSTSTSVTLSAAHNQAQYNTPDYDLNAGLSLLRPATTSAAIATTRTWNPANINLATHGYTIQAGAGDGGLDLITITNMLSGVDYFVATYLGAETTAGSGIYNLGFEQLASGDTETAGTVSGTGNDVTFTINSGSATTDDATPYYVIMDYAYMYDGPDGNASYSEMYDGGLDITNPDYYVVPEPSVIILLCGGGVAMLGIRRIFMI